MKKKEKDCSTEKTMIKIKVPPEDQGQRLDKFLKARLPQYSRSFIQKAIREGLILVNQKKTTVHYFLKINDLISYPPDKLVTQPKTEPILPAKAILDKKISPKIIAEYENFLILEKPAGLLVHPTEKNETNTLVDWLMEKYPELKKIGEDPQRPAIVHRLDREVSGLMIIPTNQASFDYFKKQFKEHKIIKKYLALAYGIVEKDEGEINFPIGRSKNHDGRFAARPISQTESGKKALTYFWVKERFKNYTLLEIEIMTGRTHQIRVHFLAYGHPIVGDQLYFNKKTKSKLELKRIFLHAYYLSFIGLNGKNFEFNSPLPATLKRVIKNLSGR